MSIFSLSDIKKRLQGKGALYIMSGSFLIKLAAFFGSIVLVRVMAKSDYGALSYMENLYTYAYLFAGFGLNNAVLRYVVLKDDIDGKSGIISYVIRCGTLFNIILVIVLALAAHVFPHQAQFSMASLMLPLMFIAIPFQFLFATGTYSLRALFMNRQFAIFAVLAAVAIWVIKVVGAKILGLFGAVLTWPVTYVVMAFIIWIYLRNRVFADSRPSRLAREEERDINRYSLQYMVTNGIWAMFLQNDLLLLGMLSGNALFVASYKVAYAIPGAMAIVSSSIGMFVAPYFVRHEQDNDWVWRNYLRVLLASAFSLGLLTIVIYALSEPIVLLVFGEQYADAVPVMRLLLIAVFISNAIRYTSANLLAAMGKIRINLLVSLLGMLMQITLDIILIPMYGMIGAAWVSIIVYALMACGVTFAFIALYKPKNRTR